MSGSIHIYNATTDELLFSGDIVNREGPWEGMLVIHDPDEETPYRVVIES